MMLWVSILALSTLLYVLLDGFDLGIGIIFGFTSDEADRRRMLSAILRALCCLAPFQRRLRYCCPRFTCPSP
jgi:hypothetical protein